MLDRGCVGVRRHGSVAPVWCVSTGGGVIETLHEHWATILVGWGNDPAGKFTQGTVRATAKVLADGRLFVRQWRGIRFTLSDDGTKLVGTRDGGDHASPFLMRRVPSEVALRSLMADTRD